MIQNIGKSVLLFTFFLFFVVFAWYIAIPLFVIFCMIFVVVHIWLRIKMWMQSRGKVEILERVSSRHHKRKKEVIDVEYTEI